MSTFPMTPNQAGHAIEFKRMVDMINADRAGRGVPPLDVEIKIPGAHDDGAFRAQ